MLLAPAVGVGGLVVLFLLVIDELVDVNGSLDVGLHSGDGNSGVGQVNGHGNLSLVVSAANEDGHFGVVLSKCIACEHSSYSY